MLKNDTQKNGTSRIGLLMEKLPPGVFNGKSKNTGKDFGSDGLFDKKDNAKKSFRLRSNKSTF